MSYLLNREEVQKLRESLDKITTTHIESIIKGLPEFRAHAMIFNIDGDFKILNLQTVIPEYMPAAVFDAAAKMNAVTIIFCYPSFTVNITSDDPKYEEFMAGEIDISTMPRDMISSSILIYSEALGPYRKASLIPINNEYHFEGEVKDVDAKVFAWFPLIYTNDMVN